MDAGEIIWHIVAVIGALKILYNLLPWLYQKLFCSINLQNYKHGYVLVTGASDGIGKAIAQEFLKKDFKVILLSRSLEKLQSVKKELISLHPNSTIEIIAADFSKSHRNSLEFYGELSQKLNEYMISVLVNNVGSGDYHFLNNLTFESIENEIGVNVYPGTIITHGLIPGFLQRRTALGQRSLIINISSVSEETLFPGGTVYSATKRYNAFFSEGLRYEYPEIDIVTVKPGAIRTQMMIKNGFTGLPLQVDPNSYAKALLGGLRTGVNYGHWKHKLFSNIIGLMPYLFNLLVLRLSIAYMIKKGNIKY
jgi:17beta-estradiol 17-dehydrogenase / very-long-chain 3-oxoacyl-CoA reductase